MQQKRKQHFHLNDLISRYAPSQIPPAAALSRVLIRKFHHRRLGETRSVSHVMQGRFREPESTDDPSKKICKSIQIASTSMLPEIPAKYGERRGSPLRGQQMAGFSRKFVTSEDGVVSEYKALRKEEELRVHEQNRMLDDMIEEISDNFQVDPAKRKQKQKVVSNLPLHGSNPQSTSKPRSELKSTCLIFTLW